MKDCEVKQIQAPALGLVDRFYKGCGEKARCGKHDRVFVLQRESECLAAARLVPVADKLWLLRNLTVAPASRRQGLARRLMQAVLAEPSTDRLFCYALPELVTFYRELGFSSTTVQAVPPAIGDPFDRYQASGKHFVLMVYNAPV